VGGGDNGVLGNGSTTSIFLPTQLGTATDWASIEADAKNSFAIKSDGTLWAWGQNLKGNLGNGNQTDLLVPTQIGTATDWSAISASFNATVALKTDGSLWAWGTNSFYQFGNGTNSNQFTPLLINACTLAIGNFDKNNTLLLYPNPAHDRVNIRFETNQKDSQVEIYDMTGRMISSFNNKETQGVYELDLAPMATGVYVVILRQGGAVLMQRKLQVY
jgi:hypothetical protein